MMRPPKKPKFKNCRNCHRTYWAYSDIPGLKGFCAAACKEAWQAKKESRKAGVAPSPARRLARSAEAHG